MILLGAISIFLILLAGFVLYHKRRLPRFPAKLRMSKPWRNGSTTMVRFYWYGIPDGMFDRVELDRVDPEFTSGKWESEIPPGTRFMHYPNLKPGTGAFGSGHVAIDKNKRWSDGGYWVTRMQGLCLWKGSGSKNTQCGPLGRYAGRLAGWRGGKRVTQWSNVVEYIHK